LKIRIKALFPKVQRYRTPNLNPQQVNWRPGQTTKSI